MNHKRRHTRQRYRQAQCGGFSKAFFRTVCVVPAYDDDADADADVYIHFKWCKYRYWQKMYPCIKTKVNIFVGVVSVRMNKSVYTHKHTFSFHSHEIRFGIHSKAFCSLGKHSTKELTATNSCQSFVSQSILCGANIQISKTSACVCVRLFQKQCTYTSRINVI